MYVKDNMTRNAYTVNPNQPISEALDIMSASKVHRLPVVDKNGKLLGLVTEKMISQNTPNNSSSLSVFELNYLLNKLNVIDIMNKEPYVIGPDALLEEAATLMNAKEVDCLPVIDENNVLIGIITHNDIFTAFIDLLGYNQNGKRYVVNVLEDKPGIMEDIARIFKENNANITNLAVYKTDRGIEVVIISQNETDISDKLTADGFNVTGVISLNK